MAKIRCLMYSLISGTSRVLSFLGFFLSLFLNFQKESENSSPILKKGRTM